MSREETIFAEALDKGSAAEQAAYLDLACAGDAQLREDVAALLAAHQRAAGILESPRPDPHVSKLSGPFTVSGRWSLTLSASVTSVGNADPHRCVASGQILVAGTNATAGLANFGPAEGGKWEYNKSGTFQVQLDGGCEDQGATMNALVQIRD
jgi:hypothetical protein